MIIYTPESYHELINASSVALNPDDETNYILVHVKRCLFYFFEDSTYNEGWRDNYAINSIFGRRNSFGLA